MSEYTTRLQRWQVRNSRPRRAPDGTPWRNVHALSIIEKDGKRVAANTVDVWCNDNNPDEVILTGPMVGSATALPTKPGISERQLSRYARKGLAARVDKSHAPRVSRRTFHPWDCVSPVVSEFHGTKRGKPGSTPSGASGTASEPTVPVPHWQEGSLFA